MAGLLVAPVVREDDQKEIYLPVGQWYTLGSNSATTGPKTLSGKAALTEVPVFVPTGTILPLAPVIQYTDALPGGALQVQVYGGADAEFTLFEDDGETLAYEKGEVRATDFKWEDASKTLSWQVKGSKLSLPQAFTELYLTLFDADHAGVNSTTKAISTGGKITVQGRDVLLV